MAGKQLLVILGVMFAFLVCTSARIIGLGSMSGVLISTGPAIGAEPLKIKLVAVTKDIPAGAEIDANSVDEHYETVDHIALDAFSFASDCIGCKDQVGTEERSVFGQA
jgi:Flp pilus assembly protein CpaB